MKLTDGMSTAKPVLSTYEGDIPSIVGDTAYLVKSDSPEAIVHTITTILRNPHEASAKGQAARLRCIKHFSFDKIGETLIHILGNQCDHIKEQGTFNRVSNFG
ncbi:MAG: glycosyltransferase [Nitrospirales bacterium]